MPGRQKTNPKAGQKGGSKDGGAPTPKPAAPVEGLGDLAIGHQPSEHRLSPQDSSLFRAFQSNLLSLISHELRTPLTGILNALNLLDSGESIGEFSEKDLIAMARQNAQRLHRALVMLLDLAALESGTFHARLREVNLVTLVQSRVQAYQSLFKDHGIDVRAQASDEATSPLLADPQKLGRAIDLLFQALIPRTDKGTKLDLRISSATVTARFKLATGMEAAWDTAWSQALTGYHGGVGSPTSLFANVLQSEQAFLTRMEEGLGSELILLHEILRLHHGKADATREGRDVTFALSLPMLASEEGLQAVLSSRVYHISTELGSLALVLIRVPEKSSAPEFMAQIRKSLFRATDAVYTLEDRGEVALVLDDCKPEDAPRLVNRIQQTVGQPLRFGISHCPADAADPALLFGLAEKRLAQKA